MSEQENIRIARQVFDNMNRHDLSASDKLMVETVRTDAAGAAPLRDREGAKQYVQNFINAFPDLKFEVQDVIAKGDKVAITWLARGTHKSTLTSMDGMSIPASNQKVECPGVTVVELRDGCIVRQQIFWDEVPFLMQVGALPRTMLSSSQGGSLT